MTRINCIFFFSSRMSLSQNNDVSLVKQKKLREAEAHYNSIHLLVQVSVRRIDM